MDYDIWFRLCYYSNIDHCSCDDADGIKQKREVDEYDEERIEIRIIRFVDQGSLPSDNVCQDIFFVVVIVTIFCCTKSKKLRAIGYYANNYRKSDYRIKQIQGEEKKSFQYNTGWNCLSNKIK